MKKSKETNPDGSAKEQPVAVDADGNPIEPDPNAANMEDPQY